jgi:two-component system heavy metal sensor histidine kinase CusS
LGTLLTSQERFVAHAAHELRSPLAALYGELQQALRKDRDAEGYKRAIEAALGATRRLNVLAEDLLTLARTRAIESLHHDSVALDVAVSEARSVVDQLARSRNVTLTTELDEPGWIPYQNGDTARLIRNLLENAVRCSPENGVVRLSASKQDGMVEITISDDGPGVAEADREAIFEPFSRVQGSAPAGYAGLGLAIAREIARAHGGDVMLDTAARENQRGARFVVSLPATR